MTNINAESNSFIKIFLGGPIMTGQQTEIWHDSTSFAFEKKNELLANLQSNEVIMDDNFLNGIIITLKLLDGLPLPENFKLIKEIITNSLDAANFYNHKNLKIDTKFIINLLISCYLIKECYNNSNFYKNSPFVDKIKDHLSELKKLSSIKITPKDYIEEMKSNKMLMTNRNGAVIFQQENIPNKVYHWTENETEIEEIKYKTLAIIEVLIEELINYLFILQSLTIKKVHNTIEDLEKMQTVFMNYTDSNYYKDSSAENKRDYLLIMQKLDKIFDSLTQTPLKPLIANAVRSAEFAIEMESDKNIDITYSADNCKINRSIVLNKLVNTLVHMIYNSISHGIEKEETRIKIGKKPKGEIKIIARKKNNKLTIKITDDGKGIDIDALYKEAIKYNLIDPNKKYTKNKQEEFIFLSGISTAKTKTVGYSGKGKFMIVSKRRLLKIGGNLTIKSKKGKGTSFILEFPEKFNLIEGLIAEADSQFFVIPDENIKAILEIPQNELIFVNPQTTLIKYLNNFVQVIPLSSIFKYLKKDKKDFSHVIIVEYKEEILGIPVNRIINEKEIIIKQPVNNTYSYSKYISGTTITTTSIPALVLNIESIFNTFFKF